MKTTLHRFHGLTGTPKLFRLLNRDLILTSLRSAADWLGAATAATGLKGACYRNAVFHESGEVAWMYPRSNTAEVIGAWLDLYETLGDACYREEAQAYAERLVSDPVHGLYRGADRSAHGLAWYWADGGTYTGGYSMRLPFYFARLHAVSGDGRLLESCEVIGKTFLARQRPNGLVASGWCPKQGWLKESRTASRYVYPLATFATLFRITGDAAYSEAYERAVGALLKMQREDGSFDQMYDVETLEALGGGIKLHFFAYIFNALKEAYEVFRDERLLDCGKRLGDWLASVFYYRHALPYCLEATYPTDRSEADSAIQDQANGLLWLYSETGEEVYLDMAVKLWLEAWTHQIDQPDRPGWHGAIVRGLHPGLKETLAGVPGNRTHLHFDPTRVGRCEVWFQAHHVFVARQLLELLATRNGA